MNKLIQNLRLLEIYSRRQQALIQTPDTTQLVNLLKNQLSQLNLTPIQLKTHLTALNLETQLKYAITHFHTATNNSQNALIQHKIQRIQHYIHAENVNISSINLLIDDVIVMLFKVKEPNWAGFSVLEKLRAGENLAAYERLLMVMADELT